MFIWEAICDDVVASRRCFLALFDMNGWYNAQMPAFIRLTICATLGCEVFVSPVN